MVGAMAMMAFAAQVFAGRPEFGNFTDAGGIAAGLEAYAGKLPAVLFAIALIDASVIGAMAVSLSTAYAIGDAMALSHSLHRKPAEAKGFYAVYCGLIVVAAALVLTPGTPLGLLTNAVQALAGVLLPSATVFLLLLCNDRAVLGPWINGRAMNIFTGAVIAVLVAMSIVLTASVLFPDAIDETAIAEILGGCAVAATLVTVGAWLLGRRGQKRKPVSAMDAMLRQTWRMPPLVKLAPANLSTLSKTWMAVLRVYLLLAAGLVLIRIVMLAFGGH